MTSQNPAPSRARRLRGIAAFYLAMVAAALAVPLATYAVIELTGPALAQGAQGDQPGSPGNGSSNGIGNGSAADAANGHDGEPAANPRANMWRGVRDGAHGYTAASGPYTTDVFINNGGENFRLIRNGWLSSIAPWVLAGVLLAIGLFHFTIGPSRVEGPISGRTMPRWTLGERVMHWYTAVLFIAMGITGFSLLFGRAVLIPVLGLPANAVWADFAKMLHNVLGPFFLAGVLLEVIVWMRYNLINRDDIRWLARLGGMFNHTHPQAGRANGGEKVWFWFIATFGLLGVGITGLILDFPGLGQNRLVMEISQVIHASLAALWTAILFGHIYLGIWGLPGTLRGMTRGYVSEEWMKTHHDRWYAKMKRQGENPDPRGAPSPAPPSQARPSAAD